VVGVWLVCQAALLSSGPIALAASVANPSADALLCTCGSGGPDHYCPMHGRHQNHRSETKPDHDAHDCVLRSGSPASDATLASLFAGIGLLPHSEPAPAAGIASESIAAVASSVLLRTDRPDSPPPRL
jgi:hypothetical protein